MKRKRFSVEQIMAVLKQLQDENARVELETCGRWIAGGEISQASGAEPDARGA